MLWYVHTSQDLSVIKNFKQITQVSHFYDFIFMVMVGVMTCKQIEPLLEVSYK